MTTVRCGKCNVLLNEPSDIPPDERKPCPECGSTARAFEVLAQCKVGIHATAGHALTRGATGRRTEYMIPEQQRQGDLVHDWVKCKSTHKLLKHPSARLFRELILNNPVVEDEVLMLFRGCSYDEEMGPTVKPTHFGPPPSGKTKAGRYNVAGEPVLYLSSSEKGVLWEINPTEESAGNLFCQRFCLPTHGLKIADFSLDSIDNFVHIVFDYAENGTRTGQIDKSDYVFSQVVARLVRASGFNGMVVPGVRAVSSEHRYTNVVIFCPGNWVQWIDYQSSPKCIDHIATQT